MAIDRNPISLGTVNTLCSVEWENEFKNKINNLVTNAADAADLLTAINNLTTQINNVQSLWTGSVVPHFGTNTPVGGYLCYGQAYNKTTDPNLYAVIGGTFPTNLPDLRGRTLFGADAMGGTAAGRMVNHPSTLGSTGGEEMHTITINELPAHAHPTQVMSSSGKGIGSNGNSNGNLAGTTDTTGGGAPMSIIPNYMTCNWVIRR